MFFSIECFCEKRKSAASEGKTHHHIRVSTSEAGEEFIDKHQTGLRVTFSWLEINLIIPFWAIVTENNALDHIAMTSQARSLRMTSGNIFP